MSLAYGSENRASPVILLETVNDHENTNLQNMNCRMIRKDFSEIVYQHM